MILRKTFLGAAFFACVICQIFSEKFEVFGVRSSFHIAQMQVNVAQAIPIAQGSELCLRIFGAALPVQCDGEAWLQQPCVIQIRHHEQAILLMNGTEGIRKNSLLFF